MGVRIGISVAAAVLATFGIWPGARPAGQAHDTAGLDYLAITILFAELVEKGGGHGV